MEGVEKLAAKVAGARALVSSTMRAIGLEGCDHRSLDSRRSERAIMQQFAKSQLLN